LWSIFWTNTQPGFFHVACGAQNISQLPWPHLYHSQEWYEKDNEMRCVWRLEISCYKANVCNESKVKTVGWQLIACKSTIVLTRLQGTWYGVTETTIYWYKPEANIPNTYF
jgi:hypothetical protein